MRTNPNDKLRPENVLSDDILSGDLLNGDSLENELPDSDQQFSKDFLNAINRDKRALEPNDRDFLADRITKSIEQSKRKRIYSWTSYAASLIVLAGLSLYFYYSNQSGIAQYAAGISVDKRSDQTQLLLPKGNVVRIESIESRIAYSKEGNAVVVDENNEMIQSVDNYEIAYNTVVVPYGKRSQLILSDGSSIWLNSGSKLVYPVKFPKDKREVYLEGEAVFEVTHNENHPFSVLTKGIEVTVWGTVFDLCAYDEDSVINTVLESGSVEVTYNKSMFGKSSVRLSPGELASYSVKTRLVGTSKVGAKDFTSWKDGYLVLEKKSLESIAHRLSRYYNVAIEFEDPELARETFSGYLDLRSSATQVLGMIAEIVDIQIVQTDKAIIIRRKTASV
jgi:ferric-dicitrate binding protein FerR (iron transport regulator)